MTGSDSKNIYDGVTLAIRISANNALMTVGERCQRYSESLSAEDTHHEVVLPIAKNTGRWETKRF